MPAASGLGLQPRSKARVSARIPHRQRQVHHWQLNAFNRLQILPGNLLWNEKYGGMLKNQFLCV